MSSMSGGDWFVQSYGWMPDGRRIFRMTWRGKFVGCFASGNHDPLEAWLEWTEATGLGSQGREDAEEILNGLVTMAAGDPAQHD
jgi:hypothetical protein